MLNAVSEYVDHERGETDASFRSMYGDRGVHYDLESKKNEV